MMKPIPFLHSENVCSSFNDVVTARGGDNGGDERSREFVEGAVSVVASGYDEVCLRMKGMVRSKIVIKLDSIY